PAFDPRLSDRAVEQLADLGVETRTNARVDDVDEHGVHIAGGGFVPAGTTIWAAGVRPVPLIDTVARAPGVLRDRTGRLEVQDDLSIPGHPEVFAIGDVACFMQDGKCLPGLAPVAQQEGRAVAKSIARTLRGEPRTRFHYVDKGIMATIGRSRAVAQIVGLRISGFIAWISWVFVHILTLVGFRNRVVVMFTWFWSYVTYKRGARLITGLTHPVYDAHHHAHHEPARVLTPAAAAMNANAPTPASSRTPAPA
ncbi:MAG: dehydrogenase, partial [Labilithrix sp.]|nr:dehydrogenase [Labilithrix sp.]